MDRDGHLENEQGTNDEYIFYRFYDLGSGCDLLSPANGGVLLFDHGIAVGLVEFCRVMCDIALVHDRCGTVRYLRRKVPKPPKYLKRLLQNDKFQTKKRHALC